MLDPALLRKDLDAVVSRLASRGFVFALESFNALESRRKALQTETENLQAQRNALAKQIGAAMLGAGFKPALHHHEAIPGENRPFIDERTGVYEYTDLVVVKSARLPSVLLECGVIVNRDEELRVQTKDYQQRIGVALAKALAAAKAQGTFNRFPSFRSAPK
jgi:hypothetical protein